MIRTEFIDLSDPFALEGKLVNRPLTVNEALEAKGVIHVHVKCDGCGTQNMIVLPVRLKNQPIEVRFTCSNCRTTWQKEMLATPVAYRAEI